MKYVATGVLVSGKRFDPIISDNFHYIRCINLWRGSVWEQDDKSKRKLLWRVYN